MEDFFYAGGMGAVLRELRPLLNLDTLTITGETLGDRLEEDNGYVDNRIIAKLQDPLEDQGGLVVLFGNLAPRGAVLKRSAADKSLFEKEGRAIVFNSGSGDRHFLHVTSSVVVHATLYSTADGIVKLRALMRPLTKR